MRTRNQLGELFNQLTVFQKGIVPKIKIPKQEMKEQAKSGLDELDKLSEQVFLLQILKRILLKDDDSIPCEFYTCSGSSFLQVNCKLSRDVKVSYFSIDEKLLNIKMYMECNQYISVV
ncbi:hypothetical protein ABPG74_009813 [Tetrahymena malaccensis]